MPMERSTAKIAIILPVILVLAAFSLSLNSLSSPITLSAFPQVPKEGMPVALSFSLKNYYLSEKEYNYEFYANGKRVLEGSTALNPLSSKEYLYMYRNPLKLGERVSFLVRVSAPAEVYEDAACKKLRIKIACVQPSAKVYEEVLSIPPYPPQVWSSFVSFATFSTSMAGLSSSMGSSVGVSSSLASSSGVALTSMAYYEESFGVNKAFNVGVIFSIVLIMILIHMELTEPFMRAVNFLARIRTRFNKLSGILFIIFMAMVLTEIVMIIM